MSENKYFRFFFKSFIFLLIVFVLDFIFGSILGHFYFSQKARNKDHVIYSMEATHEEILIFGSSRAVHHYQPKIFEQQFSASCFNVGLGAGTIYYQYAVLKSTLERYRPKMIVLDCSAGQFRVGEIMDIYILFPFYKSHEEMHPMIDLIMPYEKYKLNISQVYPFNSYLYRILSNNLKARKEGRGDGYDPLKRKWNQPLKMAEQDSTVEPDKAYLFEAFIKECLTANIKLVLIQSPYYKVFSYEDPGIKISRELAAKYNLPFFDFGKDTAYLNHRELFADEIHLNDSGATLFSRSVVDSISAIDKQNRPLK